MIKNKVLLPVSEFFSSSKTVSLLLFFAFVLIMSFLLSSQNLFFKNVIENGVSKKDIIAPKTITIIDTKKTEQYKKEMSQKVDPILTPANDEFIKTNLKTLQTSILQIRKKDVSNTVKKDEISLLFDIAEGYRKEYVVNFLLKAPESSLENIFDKSTVTLSKILSTGITEKDYEKNNMNIIIHRNVVSQVSKSQMTVITALLEQVIVPNLVIDEFATDIAKKNAQNSVKPFEVTFEKGDKILFEGEPVTKLKRDALRKAGYSVLEFNYNGVLGTFILVAIATLLFLEYLRHFEKNHLNSNLLAITATLTIIFTIIAATLSGGVSPYILPFPAFVIILAIFTNPRIAFAASTLLLTVLSIGLQYTYIFAITFLLINMVSMLAISKIKFSRRIDLIKTGLEIAVCGLVIVLSMALLEKCLVDVDNTIILEESVLTFINGIISGVIALGLLPLLENSFKIISPYGLAELADHNQPLLKRLQFEAPGTYHHSLLVSNLAEAAAEAIGANPILARVGAFYHDIGKLKRPLFFVENQSYFGIENPHAKLNPKLSKMVITAHPKDGCEIAKEYGLPPIIQKFILQHHGEGLAGYFYNQAKAEEGAENVKEENFRYTGPKPNMKETAILMIADAVESAVRALKNPSPEEIEDMIDKIILERLNDGQLSDSPLTLKDIKTIAATCSRILRGMQHNRIKYQENIAQEFDKKIERPVIDEELENKIKQLEEKNNNNEN